MRSGGWGRSYSTPKTAHWLGATATILADDNAMSAVGLGDRNGVLLAEVPEGSKAAKLGLRKHDVIRGVGEQDIQGLADFASTSTRRRPAKDPSPCNYGEIKTTRRSKSSRSKPT